MRIAVLGGTGRTGAHLVPTLLERGHQLSVLVRDPARAAAYAARVCLVEGDARDAAALRELLDGADAVVSALGPVGKDATLLREIAAALVTAMGEAGVERYVGISVAGLDLPGDRKRPRDRAISWLLTRVGGELAADRAGEHRAWEASGLAWTLVRVPRLTDGRPGPVEHDPCATGRRTTLARARLACFLADAVENRSYLREAPFLSDA